MSMYVKVKSGYRLAIHKFYSLVRSSALNSSERVIHSRVCGSSENKRLEKKETTGDL